MTPQNRFNLKSSRSRISAYQFAGLGFGVALAFAAPAYAQQATAPATAPAPTSTAGSDYEVNQDFFTQWFAMATATQAEQPKWMTPLVTVTPRLEQEVRADFDDERLVGSKGTLDNDGNGKGIEIIPAPNVELIFGVPPYEVKQPDGSKPTLAGWGDWPVFLAKYRVYSRNEQNGDEVLTAFFQVQKPTGSQAYTEGTYILQPTIAAGKGWGPFDVQGTVSMQFPKGGTAANEQGYGERLLTNAAFQYQVGLLWPEVELNNTYYVNGSREGKDQLAVTPGVILGRFEIHNRMKLIFGIGYQIAVTPKSPTYRNNMVLTMRLTF